MSNGLSETSRQAVRAYFRALETNDIASIPYAEHATFRAPLADGGSSVPVVGRDAIMAFFAAIVPRIEAVEVLNVLVDGGWAAGRARLSFSSPPGAELRTFNVFRIEDGLIVEQENHFDPRPVMPR